MKRHRFFLVLVLILLVINTLFFTAWYGLGGKKWIKHLIEKEAGKALGGELKIKSFNIGERQAYLEDITFTAQDSTLSFEISKARVQYDLFKFIFSGFRIKHILDKVELSSPVVKLKILPSEKEKPPSRFKIPDLSPYFKQIKIDNAALHLDLSIALEFGGGQLLEINQSLKNININAKNETKIQLELNAQLPGNGKLNAEVTLDRDRLDFASAHLSGFRPQYIHHSALGYPQSEIDLQLQASQASSDSPINFKGKLLAWDTKALFLHEYPVSLPFLSAEYDDNLLKVALSTSSIGKSHLGGHFEVQDPLGKLHLNNGALNVSLDLAMIDSSLSGFVDANLQAQGNLKKPEAHFTMRSQRISIQGFEINTINAFGSYADELVTIDELNAGWMDHNINAKGSFDPFALALNTDLNIAPKSWSQELALDAKAYVELSLYESLPQVAATFHHLSVKRGAAALKDFGGYVNLVPGTEGIYEGYYLDCELSSPDGQHLSAVGDVLDRSLVVDLSINNMALADIYPHELLTRFAPQVQGQIKGFMHHDSIVAQTDLFLSLNKEFQYATHLSASGSYDLKSSNAGLFASASKGSFNGKELNFELAAQLQDNVLSLGSLRVNDIVRASGKVPLNDLMASSLSFMINDVSSSEFLGFYPELEVSLPDISGVKLIGSYNFELPEQISASLDIASVQVEGLHPLSAALTLRGPPDNINIMGKIKAQNSELKLKDTQLNLLDGISLSAKGIAQAFPITDVVKDLPLSLDLSGELSFAFGSESSSLPGMQIGAKVTAPKLVFEGAPPLENLKLTALQTDRALLVDTLFVSSSGIGSLMGSGALDYNLIFGSFFEGENSLKISADLSLFEWLKSQVPLILDASGRSSFSCEISTKDDEFWIPKGKLDIRNGYLQLKDQVEPITSFNLASSIIDNKVSIDRASLVLGKGRLKFFNEFEDDISNHFFVGFLDLGILKLSTEEPGLLANIPFFTAPRSLSNVMIKGRHDPWLTVSGPFDDMKITGDVLLSDSQALYPPNTDNLLSLVYSFRGALVKTETQTQSAEAPPLPFSLDLIVRMQDNIRYVTYPANMDIKPGGFLHLIYDGRDWTAKEAVFNSEKGKIDFLGTVFEAEYLNINLLDSQDLFSIDGSFTKRSPDGTIITLKVNTDRDLSKPLMERLQFNLSSDNPSDQSITDILTRLRYTGASDAMGPAAAQPGLQDEALMLLSDNINASILSPMLYPLENEIRRALKLDGFSIKAGFIQNIFNQYSTNSNQFVDYDDTNHFMDDVNQFGAAILLNNLSISASKYLGRKMFLDYSLTLQEATDLQQRTRILVSHDTSLRMLLPQQFRLGYTFKYEPREEKLSHEVMLSRSLRFWGL